MSDREVLERLINTLPTLVLSDEEVAEFQQAIRELKAENERLRSENEHKGKANLRLADENERLKAYLSQWGVVSAARVVTLRLVGIGRSVGPPSRP